MTSRLFFASCALVLVACSSDQPGATAIDGGAAAGSAAAPTGSRAPAVQIVGRVDSRDADGPRVAWPAVRIVARFEGTAVAVRLREMAGTVDGPSRFEVLLDGKPSGDPLSVTPGEREYDLARGLSAGTHTIELYRLTEAQVGITQFLGFDFKGGVLLSPPPRASRRLEFIGDSTSNGYGIDGSGDCSFSGATQNERRSYPALVAKALDAEHTNLGYSGKGVFQNYARSDKDVFGVLYRRALPDDASSAWSFAATETADAVFVNLGGNDWDAGPEGGSAPDVEAFATTYAQLLADVRRKHPQAQIFAALGPSQTDDHPEGFEAYTNGKRALQRAVTVREDAGDAKVHYFEPRRLTDEYRTACDGHPGVQFHEMLADEISAALKEQLGW